MLERWGEKANKLFKKFIIELGIEFIIGECRWILLEWQDLCENLEQGFHDIYETLTRSRRIKKKIEWL